METQRKQREQEVCSQSDVSSQTLGQLGPQKSLKKEPGKQAKYLRQHKICLNYKLKRACMQYVDVTKSWVFILFYYHLISYLKYIHIYIYIYIYIEREREREREWKTK